MTDWTKVTAIAAILAAIATFLAPLFALRISSALDERRERVRQKFAVFQTLMEWRAATYTEQPVKALNVIDALFYDVKPVRDAWSVLFTAYCDMRLSSIEGGRIRQDKLNALLKAMAADLGLSRTFSEADFERVYNPEVLGKAYQVQIARANADYAEMFKNQPPVGGTAPLGE